MELVSIEFESGGGIMIPAIPQHIGFIHVQDGRLSSLSYEYVPDAIVKFRMASPPVRNLRNLLHDLVTGDDLLFTDVDPQAIIDTVKLSNFGGRADFSTIIYLSYLAHTSNSAKPLVGLADHMQEQFGFVPFDFKVLLALVREEPLPYFHFAPPFPLLTRGWSLLQATHENLPHRIAELSEHYRNTSWTHFDPDGVALCRDYLGEASGGGTSGQGGSISYDVPENPAPVNPHSHGPWRIQ
jgi:hypothetical protein